MARLATSHIARKKHEKKKRASRRRPKEPKDKDARRRVHQPHRRVSAHGATRRGHAARVRVRGRARGVRARARFQGRETSRARANRRDVGYENRRERGGRVPNARRPGGARACDRARGRRLRGVRRAGRGRAVLHVPLQPVRPARRGRAAQPRKRKRKRERKRKRAPGRRRDEKRNAKRTRTRTEKPPARSGRRFGSPQPAGRFGHGGPDGDRAGFRVVRLSRRRADTARHDPRGTRASVQF